MNKKPWKSVVNKVVGPAISYVPTVGPVVKTVAQLVLEAITDNPKSVEDGELEAKLEAALQRLSRENSLLNEQLLAETTGKFRRTHIHFRDTTSGAIRGYIDKSTNMVVKSSYCRYCGAAPITADGTQVEGRKTR